MHFFKVLYSAKITPWADEISPDERGLEEQEEDSEKSDNDRFRGGPCQLSELVSSLENEKASVVWY